MSFQKLFSVCRELSLQNVFGLRPVKVINIAVQGEKLGSPEWKSIVKRLFAHTNDGPLKLKSVLMRFNETFNVIAVLFGKQCNALVAQRLRRTVQIIDLYSQLYDKQQLQQFVKRLHSRLSRNKKDQSFMALFGAVLFSWEQNAISDEEVQSVEDEIRLGEGDDNDNGGQGSRRVKHVPHIGDGWQKVIDKEELIVWQKPVPASYVYEYKVYGTFHDIPARAFFDIQVDLNFRKQWDHLMVKVDVVDVDEKSGCEVVKWIQHFPYPLYSREYVFVRKIIVDTENQQLVLLSRGIEHPKCPETKNYVRVRSYKSNLILKPHTTIDEIGFDYMLTYCDDPQAAIPSVAYSWMASAGVPDYCEKMHNVAKKFHQQKQQTESSEGSPYDRISALSNKKPTIVV